MDHRLLDVHRERGAHAIDVDLVSVEALGLEEELVRGLVGETDDLVFDGGAVARADAFDLASEHGAAVDVGLDEGEGFGGGCRDVAGDLAEGRNPGCFAVLRRGAEAEGGGVGVAGLGLKARPVDRPAVEARGCAGLEAGFAEA